MCQSTLRETTVGVWAVACGRMSGVAGGRSRFHPRRAGQWQTLGWALAVLVGLLSGWPSPAAETLTLQGVTPKLEFFDDLQPYRLWQITGKNDGFTITDSNLSFYTPRFVINPGNSLHSLVIGSGGFVGLGTNGPQQVLHAVTGDTPTLRLEQGGYQIQGSVWDVHANHTGFSVHEVAPTEHYPFIIESGTPTNSLFIAANSNVGIGTNAPAKGLHVRRFHSATLRLDRFGNGGSLPAQAWDLTGSGHFALSDAGDTTIPDPVLVPFTVEANTPSYTLYLDDTGRVGMGTSAPQRKLHLSESVNPPTLRFEDASATPQTWDIKADHWGFDLVNEPGTAFETRPFTVLPDAPTASRFVATHGSIGVGTATPQVIGNAAAVGRLFNVRSDASNSRFVLQGLDGGLMEVVDLSAAANRKIFRMFSRSGFARFQVVRDDLSAIAVNNVLAIDMSNGNLGLRVAAPLHPLHLASGARCTAGGVFTNASSRALKQDITPLTSEQARETVRALQPVGFRYKHELDERYVGFIAEDVPELVATNDRQSLAPMDIAAVLTKVVQDQDRQLQDQDRRLDAQRELNAQLIRRLTDLEQKLGGNSAPTK